MTPAPEPWRLRVSSAADRQLGDLPPRIALAIIEFMTHGLVQDPRRVSKELTGAFVGLRSARRGDHRLIVELDDEARAVVVVRVAHRSVVYRPPAP